MRPDVYFAGADELTEWALKNRVVFEVECMSVFFAPVEYVIVNNLRYYRMGGSDRHLRDIARMLEVSEAGVNRLTLDDWIARQDLSAEWERALDYRDVP